MSIELVICGLLVAGFFGVKFPEFFERIARM